MGGEIYTSLYITSKKETGAGFALVYRSVEDSSDESMVAEKPKEGAG
jgi:hypothetical protein